MKSELCLLLPARGFLRECKTSNPELRPSPCSGLLLRHPFRILVSTRRAILAVAGRQVSFLVGIRVYGSRQQGGGQAVRSRCVPVPQWFRFGRRTNAPTGPPLPSISFEFPLDKVSRRFPTLQSSLSHDTDWGQAAGRLSPGGLALLTEAITRGPLGPAGSPVRDRHL